MKIASIYDFQAFPPKGGNHVHALQLMRRFMAEGHDVVTWGDDTVPGATSYPRTAAGAAALLAEVDVLYVRIDANRLGADTELVRLLKSARRPMVWEINAPANESLAYSWLGGDRDGGSGWFGQAVDRLRRRLHAWRQMPGIRAEERLRRELAQRASAATCVSSSLARYATEWLGIRRAVVLPNGADHLADTPAGPVAELPAAFAGCLSVLYAGSPMYPWQGLDVLEQTIALCEAAGDPIRFVLLMNQQAPRAITARNTVTYVKVPHEMVSGYVRAVDVGVSIYPAYPWSPWGFHNSPMKMFDYMACGKTVIGSDVGQLRELIVPGTNGLLFDNTPEDLRRRLLEVADGQYDLAAIGRVARAQVESTYNWQHIARQTLDVLQDAVHRTSTP
jgi:glycosyltransferase involved in cell wall biosynthesis